jgi:2-polyprenyl-3-methyl-5-hydroxy-6-metoxy-1,4-benzoquinol methylase
MRPNFETVSCPLCASKSEFLGVKAVMTHQVGFYKCEACYTGFRVPTPPKEAILNYYSNKSYFRYSDKVEEKNAVSQAGWIISTLKDNDIKASGYDFIEIGSGDGWLLKNISPKVASAVGYEADSESVERSKSKFMLNVKAKFFEIDDILDIKPKDKTIFALSHVLEHFDQPLEFLDKLKANFSGSYVFLEIPNGIYEVPAIRVDASPKTSLQEHLWSFTPLGLEAYLKLKEYEILKIETLGHKHYYDYHNTMWNIYDDINSVSNQSLNRELSLSKLGLRISILLLKVVYNWIKLRVFRLRFGEMHRTKLPCIRLLVRL